MNRRAQWLAVVGSASLGIAGLAGCQSMGGYSSGSWNGEASLVRAAEPEEPQTLPALQLQPLEPAKPADEDPFAPITVEQLLPATSASPRAGNAASAATYSTPPAPLPTAPSAIVPPAPMAVMHPMVPAPSPLASAGHGWDPHAAVRAGCSSCGNHGAGMNSLIDNMVIFVGADYFSNSGMINRTRLNNAADDLNVDPIDIPNLDPQRIGSMMSINAGAPFTPDGEIGFQVGGSYMETEEGAQGFFTMGLFRRVGYGDKHGINWGAVFDIAYDDFIDFAIGQLRFKAGYPLGSRDEIGGWLAVGTNVEHVELTIVTRIPLTPGPNFEDTIVARVRPEAHGYFFWSHVFAGGAESMLFIGGRENLGGAFQLGYTASLPFSDCWSLMSGGHWSKDSDSRGSWDVYLGVGYYPGGNARSTGVCGNRFLPYQDAANNTFMPMSINPLFLEVEPDTADL